MISLRSRFRPYLDGVPNYSLHICMYTHTNTHTHTHDLSQSPTLPTRPRVYKVTPHFFSRNYHDKISSVTVRYIIIIYRYILYASLVYFYYNQLRHRNIDLFLREDKKTHDVVRTIVPMERTKGQVTVSH